MAVFTAQLNHLVKTRIATRVEVSLGNCGSAKSFLNRHHFARRELLGKEMLRKIIKGRAWHLNKLCLLSPQGRVSLLSELVRRRLFCAGFIE